MGKGTKRKEKKSGHQEADGISTPEVQKASMENTFSHTEDKVESFEQTSEKEEDYAQVLDDDPYLLKEREFANSNTSVKWTNKQRTLLLASRGISSNHRHLLDDFKKLMPHSKTECKWDKARSLDLIVEAADLANCNNICYFEARRHQDLYLWMVRAPDGPSVKFEVLNVHNSLQTNFTGNHLLYSRPLLTFDNHFESQAALRLLREMLVQMLGTPRNHPKAKPFHDHVITFHWSDNKIWMRHFQIFSEKYSNRVDEQTLIEVGPRLTLNPIRIFDGPFGGKTVWQNATYMSPTAVSVLYFGNRDGRAQVRIAAKRDRRITNVIKIAKKLESKEKKQSRRNQKLDKLENLFAKA